MYVMKSSLTGNYVQRVNSNGSLSFTNSQRDALRFVNRDTAQGMRDQHNQRFLRTIRLKTKTATPVPVASPVQPLLVLTVRRQGRGYIGETVTAELTRQGICAAQIVAVLPVLSQAFDASNTRETSVVQVFYRGK